MIANVNDLIKTVVGLQFIGFHLGGQHAQAGAIELGRQRDRLRLPWSDRGQRLSLGPLSINGQGDREVANGLDAAVADQHGETGTLAGVRNP